MHTFMNVRTCNRKCVHAYVHNFRFYGENTENLERLLTMVSNDVIAVSKGLLPHNLFTETETVSGTYDEAIHQRMVVSRQSSNAVANCLQCFEAIYNECAAVHLIRHILPFSFNKIVSNNASEDF